MPSEQKPGDALLNIQVSAPGHLVLEPGGRLDAHTVADIWPAARQSIEENKPKHLLVEAGKIGYCDGSGLAFLLDLRILAQKMNFSLDIRNLKTEFQDMLDMFDVGKFTSSQQDPHRQQGIIENVGLCATGIASDIGQQISFLGQLCHEFTQAAAYPRRLRIGDILLTIERAGADAVGIVSLMGFLFGLIIAFSSAMPLRQFGVEVYVSDLVAIAMIRVLGPFITAIILAGRTGSSFAAELGTMKINEEIDALSTMGIEPVRFLVIPRIIATILVTPLLTVLANIAGLIGSGIVMLALGFPIVTYINHVQSAITVGDIWAGLAKAFVYGGIIGAIGCLRGLQTKSGPSAVGISTTRAVVSGIVLIVITEGVFSVVYHYLGI